MTVPTMFFSDWRERCGESLGVTSADYSERGNRTTAHLTEKQLRDLLDDAAHYADTSGDYWDVGPINRSAKRTLAAIKKQVQWSPR